MTKNKIHLQYGLILSAILVLLSVLYYVMNLNTAKWTQWVNILIMFAGVIFTCIQYAKANDGNVTFGNVFASGFKTTAIIALITVLFGVLFVLIFPEIKEKALEQVRLDMEKQGQSDEVIENAIAMTDKMFMVFMLAGGIFGTLFFGAIASLIGAAVAKKNPTVK
ncbi:DUF4199 domain-containing protein [Chitinophaga japonensis]|uniref:Uncharacterized protein DUF4199 n=1 Tax=Chitinophaga japonensis TaxID=104662 RepID=A0A562T6Q6_CHIJA|nr:DUF4199 domain-containing protein [Chitinophaga japonensis]TWI89231.1 uncharacterized protein DUF4199 [Chitinophaga japonensis]